MSIRDSVSPIILGVNIGQKTISACLLVGNDRKTISDVETMLSSTILFYKDILYGRRADSNLSSTSLSIKAIKEFIGLNTIPESYSEFDQGYHFVKDFNGKTMIEFNNYFEAYPDRKAAIYPEFVYALLLQNIVRKATVMEKKKVDKVVISVPTSYTLSQIQAVRKAAEWIRLRVLCIITEDQAICAHYNSMIGRSVQRTIVLDLGAGFFHISLVQTQGGIVSVMDSMKSDKLSGSLINSTLHNSFFSTIKDNTINLNIEELKVELSKEKTVTKYMGTFYTFTQDMVKESCSQIYKDIVSFVLDFMKKNTLSKDTPIIVVGGNAQIPSLRESLKAELNNLEFLNIQNHITACGCVLLGKSSLYSEDQVCNVLPHTLNYSVDQRTSFLLFNQFTPLSECSKIVDGIDTYLKEVKSDKLFIFDSSDSYIGYFELPVNNWPVDCTCWFKINKQFEVELVLVNSKGEHVYICPFYYYNVIPDESQQLFVIKNDVFLLLKRIISELLKDEYKNVPGIHDILEEFNEDVKTESIMYLCPSSDEIAQLKQIHHEYPMRYERFYKKVLYNCLFPIDRICFSVVYL